MTLPKPLIALLLATLLILVLGGGGLHWQVRSQLEATESALAVTATERRRAETDLEIERLLTRRQLQLLRDATEAGAAGGSSDDAALQVIPLRLLPKSDLDGEAVVVWQRRTGAGVLVLHPPAAPSAKAWELWIGETRVATSDVPPGRLATITFRHHTADPLAASEVTLRSQDKIVARGVD